MTLRRLASALAGLCLILGLCTTTVALSVPSYASSAPKPTVTGFTADTTTLSPLGGTVTIGAAVTNATSCSLKANHPLTGLPVTVSCGSGVVSLDVAIPANAARKPAKYKLSFSAVGHGKTTAKLVIIASSNPPTCLVMAAGENLAGCSIPLESGEDLAGANLTGATLFGSGLSGVDLSSAVLTDANLSGADLTGARLLDAVVSGAEFGSALLNHLSSGGVQGTPASLPLEWGQCGGYLVGPAADLRGADLRGLTCPLIFDFDTMTGANVTGTYLASAHFDGTLGTALEGTPAALPPGYSIDGGDLVGPEVSLAGADLSGIDLSSVDLTGVRSGGIAGAPKALPANWILASGYLVGPGANLVTAQLAGAALAGADLADANLVGADLTGANLTGVAWSDTLCPDGTNSDVDGGTCLGHLSP